MYILGAIFQVYAVKHKQSTADCEDTHQRRYTITGLLSIAGLMVMHVNFDTK
jgi:hypothetical protein